MIIKDYSRNIENFERFLKSKLCSVEEITGNDSALYKKIIYVSFIDSLAACVFPRKGNRDRFISTIERFSHWDDRNRVSITHLGKYVYSNPHPSLSDVRKYVGPVLERWRERQNENILISEDPRLSDTDIKHISWKKDKESGIDLSIDSFTHSNLLYKMRNALVHQFQSRADEILPSDPKEPFYQVILTLDEGQSTIPMRIELIYPASFLSTMAGTILDNIILYLKDGNINPFPHYYAGDYWIEELN